MINYPSWVPGVIIKAHEAMTLHDRSDDIVEESDFERVSRLIITDYSMDEVWASLKRHWRPSFSQQSLDQAFIYFYNEVLWSAAGGSSDWERISPGERTKKTGSMAELARGLAGEVTNSFNPEVSDLFNRIDRIKGFEDKYFDPNLDTFNISPEGLNGFKRDKIFTTVFGDGSIDFKDVLLAWAEWLDDKSKEPPIVPKPDGDSADIVYFIRRLSGSLKREFGSPLHKAVTITTKVVFNKHVSEHYVRMTVNRYHKSL